jgi:hypothetical protein
LKTCVEGFNFYSDAVAGICCECFFLIFFKSTTGLAQHASLPLAIVFEDKEHEKLAIKDQK